MRGKCPGEVINRAWAMVPSVRGGRGGNVYQGSIHNTGGGQGRERGSRAIKQDGWGDSMMVEDKQQLGDTGGGMGGTQERRAVWGENNRRYSKRELKPRTNVLVQ